MGVNGSRHIEHAGAVTVHLLDDTGKLRSAIGCSAVNKN